MDNVHNYYEGVIKMQAIMETLFDALFGQCYYIRGNNDIEKW